MNTNIEFLGQEQIENVITAMHFQMDRTIFFGYEETVKEYAQDATNFLKRKCGVKEVVFYILDEENLDKIYQVMKEVMEQEKKDGNQVFFDVTGGESLILVAFGMLSRDYTVPMHQYDVHEGRLIELNPEHPQSIRKALKEREIMIDLSQYIELYGGKINYKLDQDHVNPANTGFMECVRKLWPVMLKYKDNWNTYASVLQQDFKDKDKSKPLYTSAVIMSTRVDDWAEFRAYMKAIAETGAFVDYKEEKLSDHIKLEKGGIEKHIGRVKISFKYGSLAIKDCLWKGGTILELHVYEELKKSAYDCEESIHIDWDGIIRGGAGKDVYNEIDVIGISNNLPIFVSCKSGKMNSDATLKAMYELETIASRFGGKYARKALATLQSVEGVYAERAMEMGIELWHYQ